MQKENQAGSSVAFPPFPLTPTTILKAVSKPEGANNKATTNKVRIYNTVPKLKAVTDS